MPKTVAEKMGIKEDMRSIFINAPESAVMAIKLASVDLHKKLTGQFDYIHLFVITQENMHKDFPKLKEHLKESGSLWLSWPKSGKMSTDLNIKSVIKIGYDYGLVESKCISVDATWSALKFTYPKKGKSYHNSYGSLKNENSDK